jgi:hypothetical protein
MGTTGVLLLALLAGLAPGQGREEKLRAELEKRALELRVEAGERHLDYGLKLRDQGLVAQAAEQIRLAVELSERAHAQANAVLSLMQRYDDRFWKRRVDPSERKLDAYEKRARKLERADREDRFELAEWAWRKDLREEARGQFELLLDAHDGPLELDSRERVELDVGALPEELSAELVAAAVTINGRPYRRDAFLQRCPDIGEIHEHASEQLVVRCVTSVGDARALHALGAALLPHLEAELGGRPARRPHVFVFATRAGYEGYLSAAELSAWSVVDGMADVARNTAVLCAEDKSLAQVQGMLLHELTHVVDYGVSPARLPEWYREGLAEAFGGQGTFRWDGERLEVGLPMERVRLAPLMEGELPWSVSAMNAIDPLTLWASDRELAQRFYAQAWALYRYLKHEAPEATRERFEEWLAMCRGTLGGPPAPGEGSSSAESAVRLFDRLYASELPELEEDFARWLRSL